ncbi:MAG: type IV pilus modification protein PilV [Stenotrophobium sp.]
MSAQRCFTLIEVLITLVVVAIGLLTAAGMQIMSKRNIYDSQQRTAAAHMAQAILSRMSANVTQLPAYVTADATAVSAPATDCTQSACTPAQLAAWDVWSWGQTLLGAAVTDMNNNQTGGLVSPTGCVQTGANGLYVIAIAWRGVTPMSATANTSDPTDPSNNTCGASKAVYAGPGSGITFRRIMVMQTYIANPVLP